MFRFVVAVVVIFCLAPSSNLFLWSMIIMHTLMLSQSFSVFGISFICCWLSLWRIFVDGANVGGKNVLENNRNVISKQTWHNAFTLFLSLFLTQPLCSKREKNGWKNNWTNWRPWTICIHDFCVWLGFGSRAHCFIHFTVESHCVQVRSLGPVSLVFVYMCKCFRLFR